MLQVAGVLLAAVAGVVMLWIPASAANSPISQTAVLNPADPNGLAGGATFTPGTPFSSGQFVEVTAPANTSNGGTGTLAGNTNYTIAECADPGGLPANLPTSDASCDNDTALGTNGVTNADGSMDQPDYPIYSLPNKGLGETPTDLPMCNLTNACVLGVITDQGNFNDTTGVSFSQPFYVNPTAGNSGANPGDGTAPPAASEPSPSVSTVQASPAAVPADGVNASSIVVTLLSSASEPVANKSVTLSPSAGSSDISPSNGLTNSSGQVLFTVTDTSPESVSYTAQDTTDAITLSHTSTVQFTMPTVTVPPSSVTPAQQNEPNDGATAATITVTLLDQGANPTPLSGRTVTLTASGGSSTITPGSATSGASGVATFTAVDSQVEQVTYTAKDTTDGIVIGTTTVTFGTATVSATLSTVKAQGQSGACGSQTFCAEVGQSASVVVTLLSSGGAPVEGKTVTLAITAPTGNAATVQAPTSVVTDSNGQATFNVTDPNVETITVSATDTSDQLSIPLTQQIQFAAPVASATTSQVIAPSAPAPADGETTDIVDVKIEDQFGKPLPNKAVKLTPDSSSSATVLPSTSGGATGGTTGSNGEASFVVRDEVAETVTLTAVDSSDGGPTGLTITQQGEVTFVAGLPDANVSTIGVDNPQVALGSPAHITVTLRDHFASGNGNPVSGRSVSLTASGGSSTISPSQATTDSAGDAVFTVSDATPEIVTYSAEDVTDALILSAQVSVTFGTPPPPPAAVADSVMLASATSVPANGDTTATIYVLLSDANGDPLSGKTVTLSASTGSSIVTAVNATTNMQGQASFTVTDTTSESVTYTATDTTDQEPITGQSVTIEFTNASTTTTTTTSPTSTTTTSPTATTTTTAGTGTASAGGGTSGDSSGSTGAGGDASGSTGAATTAVGTDDSPSSDGSSSSPGSLAFTGAPSALPWLFGFGVFLALGGTVGRRVRVTRP